MQPGTVSLASDGLIFRAFRTVGATSADQVRPARGILALLLVTWVPPAILSLIDGTFIGHGVTMPFLGDPGVQARLLVALPLLLAAERKVSSVARMMLELIRTRRLVPEEEMPALDRRVEQLVRERDSRVVETVILVGTLAVLWFGHGAVVDQRIGTHTTWIDAGGGALSRAGWWYFTVSLFVATVLGLRWAWWIVIWTRFLVGFLRPRLVVSPGHPDLHGGLAFLTMVQSSFALVLASFSSTVAGRLGVELLYEGATLDQARVPVVVVLVLAIAVMFGPLLLFTGRLAALKRHALMQYDALGQQLVAGFDRKWLSAERPDEPLLGSPDPSTYTDYVAVYASLRQMQPTPLDVRRAAGAVVIACVPFVPLLFTAMSVKDILLRMVKLLM